LHACSQGSFPAGTPSNSVPKVILTVGTAFKPALGELYKKHPVCTKICLIGIQNRNFFPGRGTVLFPGPSPVERGTAPLPHLLGAEVDPCAYGTRSRIRRSNSAPTAPRPPPQFLILEPPLFRSHTSFLGNAVLLLTLFSVCRCARFCVTVRYFLSIGRRRNPF